MSRCGLVRQVGEFRPVMGSGVLGSQDRPPLRGVGSTYSTIATVPVRADEDAGVTNGVGLRSRRVQE